MINCGNDSTYAQLSNWVYRNNPIRNLFTPSAPELPPAIKFMDVPSDGSCFYHSVSQALCNTKNVECPSEHSVSQARKVVVGLLDSLKMNGYK